MMRIKLIKSMIQLNDRKALLWQRCTFPQTSSASNYSASSKKDNSDEDEFDKPIKFSTSKAAKFRAAYTTAAAQNKPECEALVVSLSIATFLIYFGILREENDIDEKIVEGIPPEILEQIYGKPKPKNTK